MANDSFRASILDGLIRDAGIPLVSVQVIDINAVPPNVNLVFSPSATAEQIALANQIKDAFDWRRRRALARNTVVTGFQSLTTAQQNAIIKHLVCEMMRLNPSAAAQISQFVGAPLPVDEVDPT